MRRVAADALNLLSKHPDWWKLVQSPLVITPHLGEMARLTGRPITEIRDRLVQTAQEFAMEHQITVVLKDARTITAQPDGQSYINVSGNHGMATAGAGRCAQTVRSERFWRRSWICIWRQPLVSLSMDWQEIADGRTCGTLCYDGQ